MRCRATSGEIKSWARGRGGGDEVMRRFGLAVWEEHGEKVVIIDQGINDVVSQCPMCHDCHPEQCRL